MTDRQTSFDVRIYTIGKDIRTTRRPFRVRWAVEKNRFAEYFATFKLAEGYRSRLKSAAAKGEVRP